MEKNGSSVKKYNFINDKYVIDFEVPAVLRELMDKAEAADAENDLGAYEAYADMIDVISKNCYASGFFTKAKWDTLSLRYEQ